MTDEILLSNEIEVREKNREALIYIFNSLKEILNLSTLNDETKEKLIEIEEGILFNATIKAKYIEKYEKNEKLNLKWFQDSYKEIYEANIKKEEENSKWLGGK